ncbi:hypothetical protein A3800_05975 [Streptomyces badius]|uniref:Uncharacterized protein n=1 Tax=Streptomyces cavourensis TaxID=67258 RepID=A0AAD0Q9H4_9ACTN|nr:hypothetical protein DIJ69_06095 [Streptomyces globisporus]AXI74582.1 hypothetical protein DTW94_27295 [Streptomyces cavourensis]RAN16746.1 hypothetical protein A3838_05980 [Streptomyces badius]RAN24613.1 hypothetical protein A3800_05975 [Streptomyces badius]
MDVSVADHRVTLASADELADQCAQRLGDLDRVGSQHELEGLSGVGDLGSCETRDAGAGLAVEQDEATGDAVAGSELGVVQETTAQTPTLIRLLE